jgi:hypothetical protein
VLALVLLTVSLSILGSHVRRRLDPLRSASAQEEEDK